MLPFLCDEVKRRYPAPFAADGEIWRALRESGDTYIYDAVKHGVELPLPEHIAIGLTPDGVHFESGLHLTADKVKEQSGGGHQRRDGVHFESGLHLNADKVEATSEHFVGVHL